MGGGRILAALATIPSVKVPNLGTVSYHIKNGALHCIHFGMDVGFNFANFMGQVGRVADFFVFFFFKQLYQDKKYIPVVF